MIKVIDSYKFKLRNSPIYWNTKFRGPLVKIEVSKYFVLKFVLSIPRLRLVIN